MPVNIRKVTITVGAEDLLLLQGTLRSFRPQFEEARNEVITGMLDRVEEAIHDALAPK